MNRYTTLSAALALTTILGGCGDVSGSMATLDKEEQTIPKISVAAEEQRHDVYFRGRSAALSSTETQSLTSFLTGFAGTNKEALHLTLRGNVSQPAFDSVARAAISAGVDPIKIETLRGPTAEGGASAPNTGLVEVSARLYKPQPLDCPHLTHFILLDSTNQTSSNYGCASQNNLEAMVADPRDLVHGESGGHTDSTEAGAAVDRLHNDAVKKFYSIGGGSTGANAGGGGGS